MNKLIGIWLILFSCFACTKTQESPVPNVTVNTRINLQSPVYSQLQTIGGTAMIEGGYRGILIYHKGPNEYAAYDRSCTYNSTDTCSYVRLDSAISSVGCNCCSSRFQLYDGTPTHGPANNSLRSFQTSVVDDYLYIYN